MKRWRKPSSFVMLNFRIGGGYIHHIRMDSNRVDMRSLQRFWRASVSIHSMNNHLPFLPPSQGLSRNRYSRIGMREFATYCTVQKKHPAEDSSFRCDIWSICKQLSDFWLLPLNLLTLRRTSPSNSTVDWYLLPAFFELPELLLISKNATSYSRLLRNDSHIDDNMLSDFNIILSCEIMDHRLLFKESANWETLHWFFVRQ